MTPSDTYILFPKIKTKKKRGFNPLFKKINLQLFIRKAEQEEAL